MPSRVIHIRLDDWVLLGCHDIMQAQGNAENIPMSTIARQVLTALVRKMQSTNQIPTYSREEAVQRAMELYEGAFELDIDLDLGTLVPEKEKEEDSISSIVAEALAKIEDEGVPTNLARPVEISEAADIPDMFETLDILNVDRNSFDSFKKLAPKDRFIEWAIDQNEIVQAAVCIAYDGLPNALWGTEKAEKMIKGLLERHRAG